MKPPRMARKSLTRKKGGPLRPRQGAIRGHATAGWS